MPVKWPIGESHAPPKNFGNVQNSGGAGHRLSFDIIFYNGHFDKLSDRMDAPRQPHCHSARMLALSAASWERRVSMESKRRSSRILWWKVTLRSRP